MDELIKTWKSSSADTLDAANLGAILDRGLAKSRGRLRKNLLADLGGASLVAMGFSLTAFFLDLQYRWVVACAMVAFFVLMIIHYQVKFKLLQLDDKGLLPVAEIIAVQHKRLISYRTFYQLFLPIFSTLAAIAYMQAYSSLSTLTKVAIAGGVAILGYVLAVFVWKWLYKPSERRIRALKRIEMRLNSPNEPA